MAETFGMRGKTFGLGLSQPALNKRNDLPVCFLESRLHDRKAIASHHFAYFLIYVIDVMFLDQLIVFSELCYRILWEIMSYVKYTSNPISKPLESEDFSSSR